MRSFGGIAGVLAVVSIVLPISAARASCSGASAAPAVAVSIHPAPVHYSFAETPATLAARASDSGTALGHGRALLGLTVNRYDVQIAVVAAQTGTGPRACAVLRSARVTVDAETEVLVDHRFASDSCQHEAIVDHEDQHVAIYRTALAEHQSAMEEALRAAVPPTLNTAVPADAYARLIRNALSPVLAAVRGQAEELNAALDTPTSYAAVFRRCESW